MGNLRVRNVRVSSRGRSCLEGLYGVLGGFKGMIEEVIIPLGVENFNVDLVGLNNLKRIVFERGALDRHVLKDLNTVEEVEIRSLMNGKCNISFENMPNLKRVIFKEVPFRINKNTFVNCNRLDVQDILKNGIIEIEDLAFNGVDIDRVELPDTVRVVYNNSFITNRKLNIHSNNKNLLVRTKEKCTSSVGFCIFNLVPGVFIEKPEIVSVKYNVENIDRKILKAKLLGAYNIGKGDMAETEQDVIETLEVMSEEYIKEEIEQLLDIASKYYTFSEYIISNGYSCIRSSFNETSYMCRNNSENDIVKYKKSTLVKLDKIILVYLTDKQAIINKLNNKLGYFYSLEHSIKYTIPAEKYYLDNIIETESYLTINLKNRHKFEVVY